MQRFSLMAAIVCFAIAAVIIVSGEGLRVVYSGGFFLLLGIALLVNARRGVKRKTAHPRE